MNNKFYVSYEAAKLLKEKGYNEDVRNFYDEEGLFLEIEGFYNFEYLTNEELDNNHYTAPTKSKAIDWLESNGVVVIVDISFSDETWIYSIYRKGEHLYDSIISKESCFSTRLEAEEAAIIKALGLLKGKEE